MTTITDPSAPAVLSPIDRLRKLCGWTQRDLTPLCIDGLGPEWMHKWGDGNVTRQPNAPTYPELRADLAAKLEADPDGSAHGVVLWVLADVWAHGVALWRVQGRCVFELSNGADSYSTSKSFESIAALDHAHAKGLL